MEQFILSVIVVAILAGAIAFRKLHKAIDGYALEKGKNLAQKEDIEALTRVVEDVKQQNARLLEDHKVKNQLRMAAIDKRLQAHQEAYTLWRSLLEFTFQDPVDRNCKVMECEHWWRHNCLYLEPDARDSFIEACGRVDGHHRLVQSGETAEKITENMRFIMDAGAVIVGSVQLPVISADIKPEPQIERSPA